MRILLHRWGWLIGAVCFCWLPSLQGQTVQKIEIRHVGPPAASDEMIRANIRVKVGDTYTKAGVDDDVRALYSTGIFYDIQVAQDATPAGLTLIYRVTGQFTLTEVRFQGNSGLEATRDQR